MPEDYPTIQDAVDAASDGDTVFVAPGSYSGTGFTNVSLLGKRISVGGREPNAETLLDGGGSERAFFVVSGEPPDTRITNLTFVDCRSPSPGNGGAILVSGAALTIDDCIFRQNGASRGGALWIDNGTVVIAGSTLEANVASEGGGVGLVESEVAMERCVFYYNSVGGNGGALWCESSQLAIDGCTFALNNTQGGGTVMVAAWSTVSIDRSIVANNLFSQPFLCNATVPTVRCSNMFSNWGGSWTGCLAGQEGVNGNFSALPLFCDLGGNDLRLREDSPCLPVNAG